MRDFKCLWFTSFVSNKNGNIVNHSTFFPFLDVNVRVSSLTLLGALVSAQAPLPEVQLLLQQPVTMSGDVGCTREEHMSQNWRQQCTLEDGEEGICWLLGLCVSLVTQPREGSHSDSETIPHLSPNLLEPSPVRLEALQVRSSGISVQTCCMSTCLHGVWFRSHPRYFLQVLAHLVKGYFCLTQGWLLELCQVSACCLREQDPSVQLHGTKVKWYYCPL